ncbi:MAG: leucine-rich repeat domain-containing protein [Paludibacter sp.]|nr:leucine-rich repeat domain-containing protein [Paludibacter sp.]
MSQINICKNQFLLDMVNNFKIYLLFSIVISTLIGCNDDNIFYPKVKTLNGETVVSGIRPGGLEKALFLRLKLVTKLVINDTIDSRDFQTMRDEMPNLKVLDLTNATIAAYNGYEGSAGKRVYRYSANSIPEFAFYNPEKSTANTTLNSIKLPQNIKTIRDFAFNRCAALSGTLEIPASVRDTIGNSAFSYCENISSITLSSASYIGESAFQGCVGLKGSLVIPDSVFTIKPWAFAYCENTTSVVISASVSDIGISAFNGCGNFFHVATLNTNYSSLDGVLFNSDQTFLVQYPSRKKGSYSVPNSVNIVGSYSFANCVGLTSVTIPDATFLIDERAFSGCISLSGDFKIPSGLTSIGLYVFENCPKISGFLITPENTTYTFTNGVLIESQLFIKRCLQSKTGSYIIPSEIIVIDNSAFSNCTNLSSVTIPESVISIGQRSFYNCTGLTSIWVTATTPLDLSSSPTAFEGVNLNSCTLHVPATSRNEYRSSEVWKNFLKIIEN